MHFDWDDANRAHIARHDVSTEEAEQVIQNSPVDLEVEDNDDDVHRYKQIGETYAGRILVIFSTVRGPAIRVVSAWDAPKAFKDFYLSTRAREYGG